MPSYPATSTTFVIVLDAVSKSPRIRIKALLKVPVDPLTNAVKLETLP